jgi:hypothetical protein
MTSAEQQLGVTHVSALIYIIQIHDSSEILQDDIFVFNGGWQVSVHVSQEFCLFHSTLHHTSTCKLARKHRWHHHRLAHSLASDSVIMPSYLFLFVQTHAPSSAVVWISTASVLVSTHVMEP